MRSHRLTWVGSRRAAAGLVVAVCLLVSSTAFAGSDDGWKVIAPDCEPAGAVPGSSNPTFYASNHRVVTTERGRVIVVYDGHGSGQQIRWRDSGGSWQSRTTGASTNGYLAEELPNDRPASLAIGRDSQGNQHVWMVWSGYGEEHPSPVEMRRLSALDSSNGPDVGPRLAIEPVGINMRVDMAIAGGRGAIVWTRGTGAGGFELVATWFDDLDSDTPSLEDRAVLDPNAGAEATATLVPTPAGMRAVAVSGSKLEVWAHEGGTSWEAGSGDASVSPSARPSAIVTGSGDILAAVESDAEVVEVVRFSSSGSSASESLRASGYLQPTIAGSGDRAWLVMVDAARERLVSRELSGGSWSTSDRVEIGSGAGGRLAWPNAQRATDGALRVLLDGRDCPDKENRNPVLYYQRSTDAPVDDVTRTATTVRVRRLDGGLVARGSVTPNLSGLRVTTVLARKRHGRFVELAVHKPLLSDPRSGRLDRDLSVYRTYFRRPRRGTCRVVTVLRRSGDRLGSRAVKVFSC